MCYFYIVVARPTFAKPPFVNSRGRSEKSGSSSGSKSGSGSEESDSRDRKKKDDGKKSRGRSRSGRGRDRRKDDRSRSRSEKREKSPTYSSDDMWRRLDYLGSWKGLGKKEKMRKDLSGAEKDDLKLLERKVSKRLEAGYRSSCIRSCCSILEMGYEVPKELLERMCAQVVQRPGVIQVLYTQCMCICTCIYT